MADTTKLTDKTPLTSMESVDNVVVTNGGGVDIIPKFLFARGMADGVNSSNGFIERTKFAGVLQEAGTKYSALLFIVNTEDTTRYWFGLASYHKLNYARLTKISGTLSLNSNNEGTVLPSEDGTFIYKILRLTNN